MSPCFSREGCECRPYSMACTPAPGCPEPLALHMPTTILLSIPQSPHRDASPPSASHTRNRNPNPHTNTCHTPGRHHRPRTWRRRAVPGAQNLRAAHHLDLLRPLQMVLHSKGHAGGRPRLLCAQRLLCGRRLLFSWRLLCVRCLLGWRRRGGLPLLLLLLFARLPLLELQQRSEGVSRCEPSFRRPGLGLANTCFDCSQRCVQKRVAAGAERRAGHEGCNRSLLRSLEAEADV